MPDLTDSWIQECSSGTITENVLSSKGDKDYLVSVHKDQYLDSCTCPGYGYRGKCRHITELREKLCDWSSQVGPEVQTPQQDMEAECPRCGRETVSIRIGV
jgi:hypothetical protein